MKWQKKGLIFCTDAQFAWMHSHAQCPTAIYLENKIRIYFSARNKQGESLPTFIDVDPENPSRIIYLHDKPVLNKGRLGTFDENGIIPSYLLNKDNEIYLYYAGWSQSKNVPYKNFTGLAISSDNGLSFRKISEAPILSMNEYTPLSATGPCIIFREGIYHCIYSTGKDWLEIDGKLEHTYLLTYASSYDAINWNHSGNIIISPDDRFEAHCKPTVIYCNNIYHLWFSKRGSYGFRNPGDTAYRLGYAQSQDFMNWNRMDDKAGITVSDYGWDSEMICYPHIVNAGNRTYMFYNGNGFGKSGFGYAELEMD